MKENLTLETLSQNLRAYHAEEIKGHRYFIIRHAFHASLYIDPTGFTAYTERYEYYS